MCYYISFTEYWSMINSYNNFFLSFQISRNITYKFKISKFLAFNPVQ